jgi:CubicO group peptidase (beta-lactamase class C family)
VKKSRSFPAIKKKEGGWQKIENGVQVTESVLRLLSSDHSKLTMKNVDAIMQQAIADKVFPGAVLFVSREKSLVFNKAYGMVDVFTRQAVTTDTIFDLASLTKPLATTPAMMLLLQQGRLGLDQNLGSVLPAFKEDPKSSVKIKNLLYHNSGLADYRAFFKELEHLPFAQRKKTLHSLLVKEPLVHPIGERVIYSDIGFMILAWVVEHISGKRLDHFVAEMIYAPLELDNLFFAGRNCARSPNLFAATEQCLWRHRLLIGRVHDENADVVGGVQGHAGLFGTAAAVQTLLHELLCVYHGNPAHQLFHTELVRMFFERLPDTDRALGFDMPARKNSSSGKYFSEHTVGHLGFSGTSFWMDLDRSIIVILLTNRIHPTRENETIKAFRPKLHDAVMVSLL